MSRYRRVQVSTYTDEKYLKLTPVRPSGQSLWFYLLTGRHTTAIPGLSGTGQNALAEQLRWPVAALRRHWAEIEALGMGRADWKAPCVWLPNAIRHNEPESPNVIRSWPKALLDVPACPLRREAVYELQGYVKGLGEGFRKAFDEAFAKDLAESGSGTGSGKNKERSRSEAEGHFSTVEDAVQNLLKSPRATARAS